MKRKPTEAQKQAAAARRAALSAMAERVAAMSAEQRIELIAESGEIRTCQGHPLSPRNAALLLMQRRGVSMVGGFQQWRQLGRQVRKGSKALAIFAPTATTTQRTDEDGGDAPRLRFRTVNVFDVMDTEPATATA